MTQPEYVFDHLFRNRLEMIRSQVGTELSAREQRDPAWLLYPSGHHPR